MNDRDWNEAQTAAMTPTRRVRRRRKMVLTVLPEVKPPRRRAIAPAADRKPVMGDAIQYSEDALYWNRVEKRR